MSQTKWAHQASLPPEAASAGRAREFVCQGLTEHELTHLIDDVRLAVSELATNAVLHARQPFTVCLYGDDCLVVLCVRDSSLLPPVQRGAEDLDTYGRGLAIVESLSHRGGFDRSAGAAKSVWAAFEIAPDCDSPS
jgi:anti-sigma regulatory factor (Ser/Thr protein kinase)